MSNFKPLPIAVLGAMGAAFALLAAGCGSSPHVGSNHRPTAAAAFRFASCMRDHGVADFPDPHVTTGRGHGSIAQGIPASAAASPKFKSAQKACRGIIGPPGKGGPTQGQQQTRRRDMLAFASCMRAHGISDFPDPTSAGQLTLPMLSSAGVDIHSRTFLTAGKACVGVTHGAITAAEVTSAVNGGS